MRSRRQPKRDREMTFQLAVGCGLALLGAVFNAFIVLVLTLYFLA